MSPPLNFGDPPRAPHLSHSFGTATGPPYRGREPKCIRGMRSTRPSCSATGVPPPPPQKKHYRAQGAPGCHPMGAPQARKTPNRAGPQIPAARGLPAGFGDGFGGLGLGFGVRVWGRVWGLFGEHWIKGGCWGLSWGGCSLWVPAVGWDPVGWGGVREGAAGRVGEGRGRSLSHSTGTPPPQRAQSHGGGTQPPFFFGGVHF